MLEHPTPKSADLLEAFRGSEVDNIVLILAKKDGEMIFGRFLKLDVHPNIKQAIHLNMVDLQKLF